MLILIFLIIFNLCGANQNRIIGGWPAETNQFPFQVSIRRSYSNAHFCSGIILDSYHILTAAHCMFYQWGGILTPQLITISAGQNQLNITGIERNVSAIIIHPEFNKKTLANDIAIIQLLENLPINHKNMDKIPIYDNVLKTNCTISGWGAENFTAKNPTSNELLVAEVEIIPIIECRRKYDKINLTLPENVLCAENHEKPADACQGDSGGPLICNHTLTGVISAGIGCGDVNFPGVYTNVSAYTTWIRKFIDDNNYEKIDNNYWNYLLIGTNSAVWCRGFNVFSILRL